MFPAKIIRNEPKLFQSGFEVIDDFLDDEVGVGHGAQNTSFL